MGVNTCHFTRWDVAVSSLKQVVSTYGGSAKETYKDRKIRFGLVLFSSTGELTAPLFRDPPDLIKLLDAAIADGGTRYDYAFDTVLNHFNTVLPQDPVKRRTTAVIFLTDGAPNEGCTASPVTVDNIYKMQDADGKPREIKTYVVGFGSGLTASALTCLGKLAEAGHTNANRCDSGTCLSFYVADSSASLLNSFQDIINSATEEVCDGLDNDCDGQIDNRADGSCQCVKSRTAVVTGLPHTSSTSYQQGVRLYTFLSSYANQGSCPAPKTLLSTTVEQYNKACRNQVSQALSCSAATRAGEQPSSDAYGMYCNRCCTGSGATLDPHSQTCSWPYDHACKEAPWYTSTSCVADCSTWCQQNKMVASNCNMPRGYIFRSGTGYDSNGTLTVLAAMEFGEDVLDKQPKRWLFAFLPSVDPRLKPADERPGVSKTHPDNFEFPTRAGIHWSKPPGWGDYNYQWSVNNTKLTASMLGIDTDTCATLAACETELKETIWLVLGYNETDNTSVRTHRLGAIYHSTPVTVTAPRAISRGEGYLKWLATPMGTDHFKAKTVSQRPTALYVGSNDGIMHAFHAETGLELWGYLPQTILSRMRAVTNGVNPDRSRVYTVDGSPVVQNVPMYRYFDSTNQVFVSKWRTVLLFGLRAGGRGYVAIDVTNPYQPRLLWEINNKSFKDPALLAQGTFDRLQYTYAKPLIINVMINWKGVLQERAVAVLAGGVGLDKKGSAYVINRTDPKQGGVVYLVDLESGVLIRELLPYDSSRGIVPGRERGIAAAPVTAAVLPAIADRVFVSDVMGRIFRLDLQSQNPSQWKIDLFYNLFSPAEITMPIMTAPAVTFNHRAELVLFGGTGNLQNINFVTGTNKLFSLRELRTVDPSTGVETVSAIPNFILPLHKVVPNEFSTSPGAEIASLSNTGERITGTPVIFNGTALFNTYTPTTELPICGVPGFSRVYGIHFDERCRTSNCFGLSPGSTHYYHRVQAYVDVKRTPLQCCEADGVCASGSEDYPSDATYQTNPNTCGDLNYTIPMLQDSGTTQPFQYFRYLGLGANTLSMGSNMVFQPGAVTVQRMMSGTDFVGHQIQQTSSGRMMLSFQIAGRNLGSVSQFQLDRLRAVALTTNTALTKGNFATMKIGDPAAPMSLSSWASLME